MPQNNYNQSQQEFKQFRDKLYQSFDYRRDTVMDLLHAIAANTTARSPVELSLSSLFRRGYSALLTSLAEREETGNMSWAIPLTVERVKSSQQLKQILTQSNLPWSNHLSVVVVKA